MAKQQHRIIAISVGADPKNIERIRFTDPVGVDVDECSVATAVKKIDAGSDEFMIATTVWSPIKVCHPEVNPDPAKQMDPYLRTVADSCAHSNLYSLPRF